MAINDNIDNTYTKIQIAYADNKVALDNANLARGEQCFEESEGKLYIGKGDGTNVYLSTNQQIVDLTTLIGNLQADLNAFKKACPYEIGDYYITENTTDPAVKWAGTTWTAVHNRFLLGTNLSSGLGDEGGNFNITLDITQMPKHRHRVANHTHTIPAHTHKLEVQTEAGNSYTNYAGGGDQGYRGQATTKSGGGGNTGGTAPYTDYQGSGHAINITNPYRYVKLYRRLS